MEKEKKRSKKTNEQIAKLINPLGDRIVVRRREKETQTKGGIFIPDAYQDKQIPDRGNVIAVGRGKRNEAGEFIAPEVKVGARVLFCTYAGQIFHVDEEEILVVTESDLLAIIDEAA